jgi:hypothetical protein
VALPRIGDPLVTPPRPWWLRVLVWLARLVVRRPLP